MVGQSGKKGKKSPSKKSVDAASAVDQTAQTQRRRALKAVPALTLPSNETVKEMLEPSVGANLHRFFSHTTPSFRDAGAFPLRRLWEQYDQPYGHEIPLRLGTAQLFSFYVPYLSAIRLFPSEAYRKQHDQQQQKGASKHLPKSRNAPMFEWYETLPPDQRPPLCDRVYDLASRCPLLASGSTADLDTSSSWFAISWYPILCDHYTSRALSGCFLTYHRFATSARCPMQPVLSEAKVDDATDSGGMLSHVVDPASFSPPLSTPSTMSSPTLSASASRCTSPLPARQGMCGCDSDKRFLVLLGYIDYKVRQDTWYCLQPQNDVCSPAILRERVVQLLSSLRRGHPDFNHMTKLDR